MQLFTLAFLAGWLWLAGTADAHAGFLVPIFTAIGSFIGGLGAIGQLLVGIGLRLGMSLLQKALAKKKDNRQQEPGVQGQISVGGDNPLTFVMGDFGTAGQLEYAGTWGSADNTPNAYLTHVISIADLPLALTGLWVDDKKVALPTMTGAPPTDQGWPIGEYNHEGADYLWIKFHDGTQTAADSYLTSRFGGDPDLPWVADQIGRGVPYAIITARVNSKLFSGFPRFFFETSGIKLYDVSKDSTAGGFGPQRRNDPSTWQPSNNPVVHVYNIINGIYYGAEWVYGGQTTQAYQLPSSNWIAAINACNQSIPRAGGGSEPRYRSGCQISVDQEPLGVIESLLKGCSGRFAEIGGIYKVLVGTPGAPVYSFTDEGIIITEGQSFDPFPGLEETVNGAQASYPEPGEQWAAKDAPAYYRADLEALDDNRRLATGIQFATVPYAVQVQRLLKEIVEDSRRFRVHQFYLPPEAAALEPNDVVAWTSARNSYVNKKFLVVDIQDQPNLLQMVTLKEVDPLDFAWNPLTDEKPYSIGVLPGLVFPPSQIVVGWSVFPAAIRDNNGKARRPSIEVRFAGDQDDVEFVRVQVRLAGAINPNFDAVCPYGDVGLLGSAKSIILDGVFLPATEYEVRGLFEPYGERPTSWSAWLPVTTDDIRLGGDDIYPEAIDSLIGAVKDIIKWNGNAVRDILDEIENLNAFISDVDFGSVSVAQEIKREMTATFEDVSASWDEKINLAVGPNSAIALKVETLSTEITGKVDSVLFEAWQSKVTQQGDDLTSLASITSGIQSALTGYSGPSALANAFSSVTTEVSNIGGVVSAQSNRIDSLFASLGGDTTEALFKMSVVAGPAGYARIGAYAKASIGGVERNAGFAIDLPNNVNQPSRFVAYAQQFIVMDPTNAATMATPFMVDANGVYINAAVIRKLTASQVEVTGRFNANTILQNGTLITDLIAAEACASVQFFQANGNDSVFTVSNPNGYRFVVIASAKHAASHLGASTATNPSASTLTIAANSPSGSVSGVLAYAESQYNNGFWGSGSSIGSRVIGSNSPGAGNIVVSFSATHQAPGSPSPALTTDIGVAVLLMKR